MENEFMKRGCLLPEGCKDLIDVLKSKDLTGALPVKWGTPSMLVPVIGEMTVGASMTVNELADALAQKPFQIVADLMQIGVFATVTQQIDFETVSRIVRKYGFKAK